MVRRRFFSAVSNHERVLGISFETRVKNALLRMRQRESSVPHYSV